MEIPQKPINMEIPQKPIVDCIGDEDYCGDEEDFVDNPIDDQGHYKFKDLPGGIAVFVIDNGVKIRMAYDLSNYEVIDIARFTELIESQGPEMSKLAVCPGNNQDSSIVYNNGKIIFNFTGMGSSYTSFDITVPAASAVDAFRRLI